MTTTESIGYRGLAQILQDRIRAGVYPAGELLPSQAELAEEFSVARHHIRRAQAYLVERGILHSWQGKGVVVPAGQFDYAIFERTRFGEQLRAGGHGVVTEYLGARVARAPYAVTRLLALPASARLLRVELCRHVDGSPAMLARHYYDPVSFAGIDEMISRTRSVTMAMREKGVEISRVATSMQTRLPSGGEARLLDVPPLQPMIEITGLNTDGSGQPVEVSVALARGDRIRLGVRSGG